MLKLNRSPMKQTNHSHYPIARIASGIAIACGLLVIIGWYLDIEIIKSCFVPSLVVTKANTGVCFLLSGLSLWLLQTKNSSRRIQRNFPPLPHQYIFRFPNTLARVLGVGVTIIALLTLCEYIWDWNLGIDEFLFRDTSASASTIYPGRMKFNTAINFILTGITLELLGEKKRFPQYLYAQILTLLTVLISFAVIIAHVYQVEVKGSIAPYMTPMSLQQGITFLVLGIGILSVEAHRGVMGVFTSNTYSGLLARRLLLGAIAVPFFLGWLIVQGQRANYYNPAFAVGLLVLVVIVIFAVLIWKAMVVIERLRRERDRAQAALKGYYPQQEQLTACNQQKWLEYVLNLMPTPLLFIEPKTAKVTFANRAADELAGGEFPKGVPAEEYHTVYHCTYGNGDPIPNEQMPGVRVARGETLDGFEMDWHTPIGVHSLCIFADTLPPMHNRPATCVLVFQNISKVKETEKALSLGRDRLKILFESTKDLLFSQQPVTLIDSLFRKIKTQISLDVYLNYLIDENSSIMRLESYSGLCEEVAQQIKNLEMGQSVCSTAAQERRAIYVSNVQQSTDPKTAAIRNFGITAFYSHPLIAGGKLLGIFSFGSRSRCKFSENERGMMQALCDQIAIAMERAQLISSLQQQTEQLQAANRMKDEFVGVLSHELRSPLQSILGWSQLLRSRNLSETQIAKALESIERNAKTETQVIEDLLDISQIIRGRLRLKVGCCNLVPIIESAVETVQVAAQAKEIQLKFSILDWGRVKNDESYQHHQFHNQKPQLSVTGDAERLQQIIWNLLSNAIKFTPSGGQVEIKLSQVAVNGLLDNQKQVIAQPQSPINGYAQIQVIDTGIGICPKFIPYVFERFRQADSSNTRSHGGIGIGLALVRHLVELHGGTVEVESEGEGKGATFTIQLPLITQ
ncbi:MAG: GAF domain-containing sensor histidine kinase [Nostocaceae cyanobacterium]|nr:GAF domain-containing sensor histidine kinase [Nostocaceae cyanobacterium]